jgi:predicted ATPase
MIGGVDCMAGAGQRPAAGLTEWADEPDHESRISDPGRARAEVYVVAVTRTLHIESACRTSGIQLLDARRKQPQETLI